jgi:Icc-related predicted phosphoesterase
LEDSYFIHISDTHIGSPGNFERLRSLIQTILNLPHKPDFVLHTGDIIEKCLSADGLIDTQETAKRMALFASAIKPLQEHSIQLYAVPGNHDVGLDFSEDLGWMRRAKLLQFSINEILFIGLSSSAPLPGSYTAEFTEGTLEALSDLLNSTSQQVVVFSHYPALPLDCPFVDAAMIHQNGHELHSLLQLHAARVKVVLHGHVHNPFVTVCAGITYAGLGSLEAPYSAVFSGQENWVESSSSAPQFCEVRVTKNQLWLKPVMVNGLSDFART